jgi:hypothetical protein
MSVTWDTALIFIIADVAPMSDDVFFTDSPRPWGDVLFMPLTNITPPTMG